jgi:hypothetical protein
MNQHKFARVMRAPFPAVFGIMLVIDGRARVCRARVSPMPPIRQRRRQCRSHTPRVLPRARTALRCAVLCLAAIIALPASPVAIAQDAPSPTPRFDFTRMVAHWTDYGRPDYLDFVRDAEPEVVQVGFYGAHFWSLVHTPQYGGYPAHFPVRGIDQASQWFVELNRKLHQSGVKVIGHFNVEFLVGDPDSADGPRGFFRFYRDLWDESMLGPKPEPDPLAFLERNKDGTPISDRTYAIGGMNEYWACLRNPSWQKVLKAWVRRGIELAWTATSQTTSTGTIACANTACVPFANT